MSKPKIKYPKVQFHVYGLPSNPTNWGEAADILRQQQGDFARHKKHVDTVVDRLSRIERMLAKEGK